MKNKSTKLALFICVILALLLTTACSELPDPQSAGANAYQDNSSKEGNGQKQGKQQTEKIFSVGEAVVMGKYQLTVTKVKKSNGEEFDTPKAGHEYVIVYLAINNAGEEKLSYNSFDFKMSNSQGQILDQAFTIVDTDTSLGSGELAPGGKIAGTVTFEQPKNDPSLHLIYTPNFLSDKSIKIKLK